MSNLISSVRRSFGRTPLTVFHHPAYRLPLIGLEHSLGIEPRRADFAVWVLEEWKALRQEQIRSSRPASYEELQAVHAPDYLDSLSDPRVLAPIFGVDPSDIPVDEVLYTTWVACGGTVDAAKEALSRASPVLNTLGGFHHAAPTRGSGFCPVNDVAVAIAALRRDGFQERVVVLDLDAHPPDGTVECLRDDSLAWIGSLSGSNWGDFAGPVDETVLPVGCKDGEYLAALEALLSRMPKCGLAFVIAGGDVLAEDRYGQLALTLEGARRRDARVCGALRGKASVWLPGGGYQPSAWQVLTGTGLVLAGRPAAQIQPGYDPLSAQFGRISRNIGTQLRSWDSLLNQQDLDDTLARKPASSPALFGLYTRTGLEYVLFRYGVTSHVQRLGYRNPRVELETEEGGGRIRLLADAQGQSHLLLEVVLERRSLAQHEVLFVNWLALRHPLTHFSASRPRLPGQDVPSLGLAREIAELLALMAKRLGLDGVAFQPSWYHMAYAARYRGRFIDPKRQGRFEALVRDLKGVPLLAATSAVEEGRVKLNGQPYRWEPDPMVIWLNAPSFDEAVASEERERSSFTVESAASSSG